MTPPLLADTAPFTSPVALGVSAGIYTAVQVPTLAEVRDRRRQPCVCTDGTCRRCFLDEDAAYERSLDQ